VRFGGAARSLARVCGRLLALSKRFNHIQRPPSVNHFAI
jgi:hypothetical protein